MNVIQEPSRTICFLLLPQVHLLDLSGPVQVFYEATCLSSHHYEILYCSPFSEVTSEQGLSFAGLRSLKDVCLKPGDFVFIPGMDFKSFTQGKMKQAIAQIKPWLKIQLQNGVKLASICSGAFVLAEAGLLNQRKCTTHWKCIEYFKTHYPEVQVQIDKLFVQDGNIYTSAGMSSGIDMALAILEKNHGPILPAKVAREIVVFLRRDQAETQTIYLDYRTHFNPSIHRIQDYIISHPEKNPSLNELATVGNISVRNLTRVFKKSTGHTIIEFKNAVKVELAKTLMHNENYSLEKVAGICGFQSVRHFRRIWHNQMGHTLKTFRQTVAV